MLKEIFPGVCARKDGDDDDDEDNDDENNR